MFSVESAKVLFNSKLDLDKSKKGKAGKDWIQANINARILSICSAGLKQIEELTILQTFNQSSVYILEKSKALLESLETKVSTLETLEVKTITEFSGDKQNAISKTLLNKKAELSLWEKHSTQANILPPIETCAINRAERRALDAHKGLKLVSRDGNTIKAKCGEATIMVALTFKGKSCVAHIMDETKLVVSPNF